MMNFFCDGIRHDLSLFSADLKKYSGFLDKIGEVCGGKIAANAASVDEKG